MGEVQEADETDLPGDRWRQLARLCALGHRLWHEPIARRRAWLVLAAVLVCGYSLWVLGYVIAMPEIGVRCAFTPVVNNFYSEFLYPEDQEPLREKDIIVKVADQDVANWSDFLRDARLATKRPGSHSGVDGQELSRRSHISHLCAAGRAAIGPRGVRTTRRTWPAYGLVPAEVFAHRGADAVDSVVLPQDRPVHRRRHRLLEAARRSAGRAVLLAVHRLVRRLHGRLSLVAHRHPAGADPGVHALRRAAAGGDAALLSRLPSTQGLFRPASPRRPVVRLRPAGVLPAAAVSGLFARALAGRPAGRRRRAVPRDGRRAAAGRRGRQHARSDALPDLCVFRRRGAVVPAQRGLPGSQLSHGRYADRAQSGQVDSRRHGGGAACRSAIRSTSPSGTRGDSAAGRERGPCSPPRPASRRPTRSASRAIV